MICPHCGNEVSKFSLGKHAKTCVKNPEVVRVLSQWLPDPVQHGCIRTERDYMENTPHWPSATLLRQAYGTWQALASAYGLRMLSSNERRWAEKLTVTGVELRRLSQELHGGQFAPTQNEYHVYAHEAGQMSGPLEIGTLIRHFESWPAVLTHFEIGLPLPKRNKPKNEDDYELSYISSSYWFSDWYTISYTPITFAYA